MGLLGAVSWALLSTGPAAAAEDRPVVTIAVPTGTAPFSAGGSDLAGFDVDLLRSASGVGQLSLRIRPVQGVEEGLELLASHEVDGVAGVALGLSGASNTAFTPYRESTYVGYVRKDALYRDARDLASAHIAVPENSAPWQYAKMRGWNVTAAASWADAFDQVESGRADAVIAEEATGRHYSVSLRQTPGTVFNAATGLAVLPGATEWRGALEGGLMALERTGHRAWLANRWALNATAEAGIPWRVNGFALISGLLVLTAAILIFTAVPGSYRLLPRRGAIGVNTVMRIP